MDHKLLSLLCLTILLCAGQCEEVTGDYNERPHNVFSIIVHDATKECTRFQIPDETYDMWGEGSGFEPNMPHTRRIGTEVNKTITKWVEGYLSGLWLTRFVPSVYTLVFIVSLPLNVMAIIIFLCKIKIRKPTVVYMLNLAAADVLFAIVLPFIIVYRFSGNDWLIGEGMCRIVTAAFYCNMYCSILLMTSISVDRFLAVVYPIQSFTWRTMSRAWLVCVFIWIISIASVVPLFFNVQTQHIPSLNITTCHDVVDLREMKSFYLYYFSALILVFFVLPLIITTISYVFIIHTLSSSAIENSCKKTRALVLAIIVLCVFIMCFGPTNCILLIHYLYFHHGANESLYFAYILCVCISSISCCLDPVIYYYASSQCKKYLYSSVCCKKSYKNIINIASLVSSSNENKTGTTTATNSIYQEMLS